MALFTTAYLPPVNFFAAMVRSGKIVLEKHEHYIKQTFRNRALIAGANGIHQLIVPVKHLDLYRKPIHEIEVSRDSPWQKIHWRTITSAYRNAAFFEYFEDDFEKIYRQKATTLFDFNLTLLQKLFSLLQIPFTPGFTTDYNEISPETPDLRNLVIPDHEKKSISPYRQVFSERHGFLPNLSVIDLLFNLGPEAKTYIRALSNEGENYL